VIDDNQKNTGAHDGKPHGDGADDVLRLKVTRPAGTAEVAPKKLKIDNNASLISHPQNNEPHRTPQPPPQHQFDEELSTFFRDRRLATAQQLDVIPILAGLGKLLVVILVMCALLVFFWNYSASLRVKTQAVGFEYLDVNMAQKIPSWTRKAKQFRLQNTTELGRFHAQSGRSKVKASVVNSNPTLSAILRGYWPQVDRRLSSDCNRWQVSKECSLKAWYFAYKGLRATLKPISMFDLDLVQKLPHMEQALLLFAMSQTVMGQRSDELFDRSLQLATSDQNLRKTIIDTKIKSIVKEKQWMALPRIMSQASTTETTSADRLKWNALQVAATFKFQGSGPVGSSSQDTEVRRKISELMRTDAASLKTDPVAFLILAPTMLRLGMWKDVGSIAEAVASQENPREFDPGLYRDISIFAIRAHMQAGQLGNAIDRAKALQNSVGIDAVSQHLLGSTLLAIKNISSNRAAVGAFKKALTGQSLWQSQLGQFLALTRAGRSAEAQSLAPRLQKSMNTSNAVWIKMALAEFKLKLAKQSTTTQSQRQFQAIAAELGPLYRKNSSWPTLSELYATALLGAGNADMARKVQIRADRQSDQMRYVSSMEFLSSPLGPFALMR
jgi:hypothetical protein